MNLGKIFVEIAARMIDWCGVLKFTELTVAELFKTSIAISSSTVYQKGASLLVRLKCGASKQKLEG